MTNIVKKIKPKDLGNNTIDVILDNNPIDKTDLFDPEAWDADASGWAYGYPVFSASTEDVDPPYSHLKRPFINIYFKNGRFKSQQQEDFVADKTTFFEIDEKGRLKKFSISIFGYHDYWSREISDGIYLALSGKFEVDANLIATLNFQIENNQFVKKWVDHYGCVIEKDGEKYLSEHKTEFKGEDTLENIYKQIYGNKEQHFYFDDFSDTLFETEYDGEYLKKISFGYINEKFSLTQLSFDLKI